MVSFRFLQNPATWMKCSLHFCAHVLNNKLQREPHFQLQWAQARAADIQLVVKSSCEIESMRPFQLRLNTLCDRHSEEPAQVAGLVARACYAHPGSFSCLITGHW